MKRSCAASLIALALAFLSSIAKPESAYAQAKTSEWKLTPLFAIGEENSNVVLEQPRSLQLLRDGRLLIADPKARTIHFADSLGRTLKPIGRQGAGPAEYGNVLALATIGDTIAVLDISNTRIGLFNTRGEWQGHWITQRIAGDGTRLFRTQANEFYGYGVKPDGKTLRTTYIRYDKSGVRDTLLPDPLPSVSSGVLCNAPNNGMSFFSSVYGRKLLRIPGAGSTVLEGMNDKYVLDLKRPGGNVVTTYKGSATRVPLNDNDWEKSIAEFTAFAKKNTTGACDKSSIDRPSLKPAIRAAWWDDKGRLWVERYIATGFAFDIFARSGAQIATISAPERVEEVEPNVVGNKIAILSLTADGIPIARVYRISPR